MDKYETPSMEIEIMESEDIIRTSSEPRPGENETPFVPTNGWQ